MGSTARFLVVAGAAWFGICAPARAEEPGTGADASARERCLDQHEQAQAARLGGHLLAARAALRECSAAACPALVSRDCLGWLSEVEQLTPTVIFRAAKDGVDLEKLRIREGELLVTDSITGRPLPLDPGPHHFTAELPGFPPQQATYVLHAGEKGRVVRFDFVTPEPTPIAPAATPATPVVKDRASLERPVPTVSYAFGAAALAAGTAGVVLGGLALARRQDVNERCAPLCRDSDVRGVKQLALAADISFVLAFLSAVGAGYTYATRPTQPSSPRALAVTLTAQPRHVGITAGGRF
jgi:hypothetical protein